MYSSPVLNENLTLIPKVLSQRMKKLEIVFVFGCSIYVFQPSLIKMQNDTTDTVNIVFIKDPSVPGVKYASFAVLILPSVHKFR